MRLYLDFETRSVVDLKANGLMRYAQDASTEIMCYSYAIDDGPVVEVLPVNGKLAPPPGCENAEMVAHNAQFEFAIWNNVATRRYGWPTLLLEQVTCTMARCYALALPGALEDAAATLGLQTRKDIEGYNLMLRMCKPRGMDVNGDPIWYGTPDDFKRLSKYCATDVKVERAIFKRTFALSPSERALWNLDQRINMSGVPFDLDAVRGALDVAELERERLNQRMARVTDNHVTVATNVMALKDWAADYGVATDSVSKYVLEELLKIDNLPPVVAEALELRREASRFTSLAKVKAIIDREVMGRVYYTLQYHAATTGRWAGRGVQPHNMTRDLPDDPAEVEQILKAVAARDTFVIELFGPVVATISRCLRGLIKAPKDKKLLGGDYKSIEGRGAAWLAAEEWVLKAYREFDADPTLPDMYQYTYGTGFGIDPAQVTKPQRQLGKVQELAFWYQGGVGAFHSMAKNYGVHVSDAEADTLKTAWREAHPKAKEMWYNFQRAAILAAAKPEQQSTNYVSFLRKGPFLLCRLPSGRVLAYPYPQVRHDENWGDYLTFMTVPDQVKWGVYTKQKEEGLPNTTNIVDDPRNSRKWARIKTYGGSLTENITQAMCRDILAESMMLMDARGLVPVLHVHDEIICEGSEEDLPTFQECMLTQPRWAPSLPIAASAWCAERYQK